MKFMPPVLSLRYILSTAIAILLLAIASFGQGGENIYEFAGGLDGQQPSGAVIFDSSGSLYGITSSGGAYSQGTAYKLTAPSTPGAPWIKEVLYNFTSGVDGGHPFTALVFNKNGSLYGLTASGGNPPQCGGHGCGVIFQLSPPAIPGGPWTETAIYKFQNEQPRIGLTVDAAGALYTAASSFTTNYTYIFKLSPPQEKGGVWTKAILSDVAFNIMPDLVFDNEGALYGAVWSAIFKLSPPASPRGNWTFRYIYYLDSTPFPYAGPIFNKGTGHLFGTAPLGGLVGCGESCGVVYELAEVQGVWHEEEIYDFEDQSDGFYPKDAVTFDSTGALYTTSSTSGQGGPGSVIRVVRGTKGEWKETTLWTVTGLGESDPSAVVVYDGSLFGTTKGGGSGYGAVFQVKP